MYPGRPKRPPVCFWGGKDLIKRLLNSPKVLLVKLFKTIMLGSSILMIGIMSSRLFQDMSIGWMALILFCCYMVKALQLAGKLLNRRYSVLEGKCISIAPISFTGYVQVTIDDITYGPVSCRVPKSSAPDRVGKVYRLYFDRADDGFSAVYLLGIEINCSSKANN